MNHDEQDLWNIFAAATLASCTGADGPMMPGEAAAHAANTADALLEERRQRLAEKDDG